LPQHRRVKVAGLVLVRQRPRTASGVIVATREDEQGVINLIIWRKVFERDRKAAPGSRLLYAEGKLEREDGVIHVIADRLVDQTALLGELSQIDVDGAFDGVQSRADEMQKPPPGHFKTIREVEVSFPDGRNFR